jgi:hypothetical protein
VCPPLLQALPFPSTLGEVTLHQLSQACIFIYSSHGKWVFPLLLWSFAPTATSTSFSTPDCWVCATTPAFSSWLVYLQLMWEVGHSPSPVEFLPMPLLQAFPLLVAGSVPLLLPSCLLLLTCEGFPLLTSSALRVPCPLCYASFFVIAYCSVFFSFIPWVGVGLSRGLC